MKLGWFSGGKVFFCSNFCLVCLEFFLAGKDGKPLETRGLGLHFSYQTCMVF